MFAMAEQRTKLVSRAWHGREYTIFFYQKELLGRVQQAAQINFKVAFYSSVLAQAPQRLPDTVPSLPFPIQSLLRMARYHIRGLLPDRKPACLLISG